MAMKTLAWEPGITVDGATADLHFRESSTGELRGYQMPLKEALSYGQSIVAACSNSSKTAYRAGQ